MKIGIARSELFFFIWTKMKKENPNHHICSKNYKSLTKYWASVCRYPNGKLWAKKSLIKILKESLAKLASDLKDYSNVEKVIIYKIKYKTKKTKIYQENESMKNANELKSLVDNSIRTTFKEVLIGAKSIEIKDFESARIRDEFFKNSNITPIKKLDTLLTLKIQIN